MNAFELAPRELMRLLTPAPRPARSSCRSPTCVQVLHWSEPACRLAVACQRIAVAHREADLNRVPWPFTLSPETNPTRDLSSPCPR